MMRWSHVVPVLWTLAACSPAAPPAPPSAPAAPPPAVAKVEAPGMAEVRYFVLDKSCPYCRDIQRYVDGGGKEPSADPPLAKAYEGRVRFVFRPAFTEKWDPNPEMKPFDFGGSAHGFAGIAADGTVRFVLPGHHVTRAELEDRIQTLLR